MGLIKATVAAAGGVLADQWRDYIYGGEMNADVLVMKGKKRTSRRSSNTDGEDNIISNGSIVAVNEGQAMIIVEQGKVVDLCAEPGEYVYDRSTEPSLFTGNLSQSIKDVFHRIGRLLPLAEIQGMTSACTISIPRKLWETNMGHRERFHSAWWIDGLVWMWILRLSASENTAIAWIIPYCSIPTCAAMWMKNILETGWTGS